MLSCEHGEVANRRSGRLAVIMAWPTPSNSNLTPFSSGLSAIYPQPMATE